MSCEVHTAAQWHAAATEVAGLLDAIGQAGENTMHNLSAVSAGREQMTQTAAWVDGVNGFLETVRGGIDAVNTRQDPISDAVQSAGGSTEVAATNSGYYDEL